MPGFSNFQEKRKQTQLNRLKRKAFDRVKEKEEQINSPNVFKRTLYKFCKWGIHLDKPAKALVFIPFVPKVVAYALIGVDALSEMVVAKWKKEMGD